jgi:hypothetical protein
MDKKEGDRKASREGAIEFNKRCKLYRKKKKKVVVDGKREKEARVGVGVRRPFPLCV